MCGYDKQIKTCNSINKWKNAYIFKSKVDIAFLQGWFWSATVVRSVPVPPAVQCSSSSKCVSPPTPGPGPKAWANVPLGPSNGYKSPWSSWYNPDQTWNRNHRETNVFHAKRKLLASVCLIQMSLSDAAASAQWWLAAKVQLKLPMCISMLYLQITLIYMMKIQCKTSFCEHELTQTQDSN